MRVWEAGIKLPPNFSGGTHPGYKEPFKDDSRDGRGWWRKKGGVTTSPGEGRDEDKG